MTGAHSVPRGAIIPDGDGFGVPALGGVLNVKYGALTYEDAGVATTVFTLPAGAIPIAWLVNITAAFNSSGTDLLDIGTTGSAAAYANDLDISAIGQIPNGYVPGALFTQLEADTPVIATYTQSVADADAGALTIGCIYIVK